MEDSPCIRRASSVCWTNPHAEALVPKTSVYTNFTTLPIRRSNANKERALLGIRESQSLLENFTPVERLGFPFGPGNFPAGKFPSNPRRKPSSWLSSPLSHFVPAERLGFEPRVTCATTVFKTVAFDHSAISPNPTNLQINYKSTNVKFVNL